MLFNRRQRLLVNAGWFDFVIFARTRRHDENWHWVCGRRCRRLWSCCFMASTILRFVHNNSLVRDFCCTVSTILLIFIRDDDQSWFMVCEIFKLYLICSIGKATVVQDNLLVFDNLKFAIWKLSLLMLVISCVIAGSFRIIHSFPSFFLELFEIQLLNTPLSFTHTRFS